jgi:hypothetical protein
MVSLIIWKTRNQCSQSYILHLREREGEIPIVLDEARFKVLFPGVRLNSVPSQPGKVRIEIGGNIDSP